jgi:pimeloyl-ACP methyl ester carboxylesterase
MQQTDPITFENSTGNRLFGTFHRPAAPIPGQPCIVLLSPGVMMRVGPQLLYNHLTREFLELGYSVFRFDFEGLGDSEGELEHTKLADVYGDIEVGRFVEDTRDALNWLQQEYAIDRVILAGLCGGAITGLLAGNRDERVKGLLSLGMTVTLASVSANPALFLTEGELTTLRRGYFQRLLKPDAWLRFITFKSDYRVLWRSLTQMFRKPTATKPPPTETEKLSAPSEPDPEDNANPLFPPALFDMLGRGAPVLFIFSGADRLYARYQEKFEARYDAELAAGDHDFEVHVVADANHIFTFDVWREEMLSIARTWLERHFPASVAEEPG